MFIILLKNENLRNALYKYLKLKKIQTNFHYIPIYNHPLYEKNAHYKKVKLENAEKYYNKALSLPIHYNLKKSEVLRIIKEINLFFLNV